MGRAAHAGDAIMTHPSSGQDLPRVQLLTQRAFATVERFMHIQAASGIVLLVAACIAMIWANTVFAPSYHALWHMPLSIGLGELSFTQPLHFWINDVLMTVFFLVVGMEVRREIHEGSLSSPRQAMLPIAAAAGGVMAEELPAAQVRPGAGPGGFADVRQDNRYEAPPFQATHGLHERPDERHWRLAWQVFPPASPCSGWYRRHPRRTRASVPRSGRGSLRHRPTSATSR